VLYAIALAALIGAVFFGIWWFTAPKPTATVEELSSPPPAARVEPPAAAELTLPRGGSLTGSASSADATVWLTRATLVRINRSTDRVEPWLAESWTASADNLTYTLKLRPGIAWSDGTPLTAADVAASLELAQVIGKPLATRAVDPVTIEITFPQPFAPGIRLLDSYPILPQHTRSTRAGLGPFVPAPRRSGGSATFVRNPRYWRQAPDGSLLPYIDELTIAPGSPGAQDFSDSAVAVEDVEEIKKMEQSGKVRLFELGPGLDADALWFLGRRSLGEGDLSRRSLADKPWLGNETFRLAISTAVDRRAYCKQVFFGACDPMAGPVSPANVSWFNPDLPLGPGNPQLARKMLGELGLRDRTGSGLLEDATRRPVRFSLLIRRDVASAARAAAFLTETLRTVGIGVDVTAVDAATLQSRKMKGNYDAIYDRIEVRETDPAMNLNFWLSSGNAHVWASAGGRPFDWERQIDELMLKNATTFDRIERLQAFVDVQRIYSQHMPALFFGVPHVRIVTSTRVLNATPSPLRPHLLWNAENLAALKP
jgi:peptide/nickel transport system substrate-binding protein